MAIANTQTTGVLNIGSAVRTGTGAINIGTLSQAPINIGTAATAAGNSLMKMGSPFTSVYINSDATIYGNLGINTSFSIVRMRLRQI